MFSYQGDMKIDAGLRAMRGKRVQCPCCPAAVCSECSSTGAEPVPVKVTGDQPGRRRNALIYEPESLLAIGFIDGLTRDGEMDARFVCPHGHL